MIPSPPPSAPSSPLPPPTPATPYPRSVPPPPPSSPRTSSTISSPPFWHSTSTAPVPLADRLRPRAHTRSSSTDSASSSLLHAASRITLRDNEALDPPRSDACWARSVSVTNYVVVEGGSIPIPLISFPRLRGLGDGSLKAPGPGFKGIRLPGAFVTWNIRVETLSGSVMSITKRYSEFDGFRARLVKTFPAFEGAVPKLPPKSVIAKFRPKFLEKRRAGLQYFLNCILLNPEFSGSPVLKEFLFN